MPTSAVRNDGSALNSTEKYTVKSIRIGNDQKIFQIDESDVNCKEKGSASSGYLIRLSDPSFLHTKPHTSRERLADYTKIFQYHSPTKRVNI